jgi:hypothetical protein
LIGNAALRRLSTLLVWLFLAAQICGVAPLLGEHTGHVTESQLVLSNAAVMGTIAPGHHHNGDADGAIQHHELQDLNGVPVRLMAGCDLATSPNSITAYVSDALVESSPVLLERPPRPFLSV